MSLILATGSNQGDRKKNLFQAQEKLQQTFEIIAASQIYESKAVEYSNQPDFLNQVLEFKIPDQLTPSKAMVHILTIEASLGRVRHIPKGPRLIDIDIIFWGLEHVATTDVIIPHPRCFERSFVIKPLQELPFFKILEKYFTIPSTFSHKAEPI